MYIHKRTHNTNTNTQQCVLTVCGHGETKQKQRITLSKRRTAMLLQLEKQTKITTNAVFTVCSALEQEQKQRIIVCKTLTHTTQRAHGIKFTKKTRGTHTQHTNQPY